MDSRFQILEHPADVGIEAYGSSQKEVFENAAHGLFSLIAVSKGIEPREERRVSIEATDIENLLVKWLNELLYFHDAENFLTATIKITDIFQNSLEGLIIGETYDARRHELKLDVKAITYHQLQIENTSGLWKARFFVDV